MTETVTSRRAQGSTLPDSTTMLDDGLAFGERGNAGADQAGTTLQPAVSTTPAAPWHANAAAGPAPLRAARISVVVLTYNRLHEVQQTVARLKALHPAVPLIVVDNGSSDGTAKQLQRLHPDITVVALPENLGAAGRNAGVARVTTDYVAFCDDDTWWAAGSLETAANLLDAHREIAVLSSAIAVGASEAEDETCRLMSASPLAAEGMPGPLLIGYMAGASVFRVCAFREVGGYTDRLFIGGEEELVALDLLEAGWSIVYAPMLLVHHHPSAWRDAPRRMRLLARNAVWVAAMRLPFGTALRRLARALRVMARERVLWRGLRDLFAGLPWALRQRRRVSRRVQSMLDRVAASERDGRGVRTTAQGRSDSVTGGRSARDASTA
ncbi:glycosyltransferase family 2 protein [Chitinasiproducens palmae]|uniref:Glycosyltransferase, GT2 family n=1 Tax=Chitinasiproducens palmae TaxID=1770053 RepID=A0A1H2PQQ1_9BURK|nr:glycosyltransferase [Chitinasiproducens palmae]SDV49127.1 Glycosyltransferase, GT2 family [Chitinasiproducens palmae]